MGMGQTGQHRKESARETRASLQTETSENFQSSGEPAKNGGEREAGQREGRGGRSTKSFPNGG